ncbi:hypothetical protein [Pontiella agarivorans]|uniref:Uncharacterized protein n=1 Tax=Pontiella agarivorans TaxID=3038953 RepID=A0ABU5MWV9_9BACT|nr:hypothetical protein [Pontiella agarivorans]MDZ8118704.1 hypothetical protein [Pontiella agarivorans]
MNLKFFTLATVLAATAVQAQTVVIDSLDRNGTLTATVPSNSVYTIEWKGALDGPGDWKDSWYQHRDMLSSNGMIEAEIPMFFRLTCQTNNALIHVPVGRIYHYHVTNQDPGTDFWRRDVHVMGDTYMPHQTNNYRTIWTEDWYSAPNVIPVGAQARSSSYLRVDENGVYVLDSEYDRGPMQEDLLWSNGTVGTTWSYAASTPHTTIQSEIVATNVTVTIGTTNYTGCIQIESIGEDQPWLSDYPERRYIEWIQPNGYLVRSENYWVEEQYTNLTPIVTELQSWTDE